MATEKIIAEVSNPAFYARVGFLALKAAQNVATEASDAPNHTARVAYASKIFRGEDSAILIAAHVVASNPTITATIEAESGAEVPDGDIEFALGSIWDARANAFFTPAE